MNFKHIIETSDYGLRDTQEHVEIGEDMKKEFIEDLIKITKKRIDMVNKMIKGGSV